MESAPSIEMETPSETTLSKTYKVFSESKNEFDILFEIKGSLLYISTEVKKNANSFEKVKYKNQYSLNDIQKVKFFKAYDTIEECLSEIDINKGTITEEKSKSQLDLVIPINSKKYPEIVFSLLIKEYTDKEKINELYGIIHNLNEKINSLEKTIENMNNNEIKILNSEKEPNGICLEINAITNSDFGKYFDENKNLKENFYFLMNFDLKKNINISDEELNNINFNIGGNIPNNMKTCVEKKKNFISIYFNNTRKFNEEDKIVFSFLKYFFGTEEQKNVKLIFNSELQIKDIFDIDNFEDFYNKIIICQLILNGLTNNGKLLLINLINYLNSKLEYEKKETAKLVLLHLTLYMSWREFTLPAPSEFFCQILNIMNTSINNINDIYLKLKQFVSYFFDKSNPFWNIFKEKNLEILEKINFEEISIIIPLYQLNIGYNIKLRLKGIFDLIEEKVIKNLKK